VTKTDNKASSAIRLDSTSNLARNCPISPPVATT
jgi:hypothetical protein